jgi:ribosomal protein S18 acetylase RimI-like enzyme
VDEARSWWKKAVESASPKAVFLVARDAQGIAGTVQLHPARPPNQPHRADIAKLLVHRRARRQGMGEALMRRIENEASARGFTLLTLDTVRGEAGERLYHRLGWTEVGIIPDYALYPDGTPCDTVVFYKRLD